MTGALAREAPAGEGLGGAAGVAWGGGDAPRGGGRGRGEGGTRGRREDRGAEWAGFRRAGHGVFAGLLGVPLGAGKPGEHGAMVSAQSTAAGWKGALGVSCAADKREQRRKGREEAQAEQQDEESARH